MIGDNGCQALSKANWPNLRIFDLCIHSLTKVEITLEPGELSTCLRVIGKT